MIFSPGLEGSVSIVTPVAEFTSAFQRRVEAGLLSGRPHPRSRYIATPKAAGQLHVSAADWWTAVNVGLNEVELGMSEAGRLHYEIRYWRWAAYVLGSSAGLAAIMVAVLLAMDLPDYLGPHPAGTIPGLSPDQHVVIAWGMVVFWGFVWPWLLIALHKRPLRRLIERLIAEVDQGAQTGRT